MIEGAGGLGAPLMARLSEEGITVVDVPPMLAARLRLLSTGHGRKSDAADARVGLEGARRQPVNGVLRHLPALCCPGAVKTGQRWALRDVGADVRAADPATVGLVAVEVEVEEITVDAVQAEPPSGSGAQDFVWDEESESQELRQARRDAELTASADSVRAYRKQIGKVALLTAEQEVDLAKRIEAGLFAAEGLRRAEDSTEKALPAAATCARSCVTASAPNTTCWRPTFVWWSRKPSATPAAAWRCWI